MLMVVYGSSYIIVADGLGSHQGTSNHNDDQQLIISYPTPITTGCIDSSISNPLSKKSLHMPP